MTAQTRADVLRRLDAGNSIGSIAQNGLERLVNDVGQIDGAAWRVESHIAMYAPEPYKLVRELMRQLDVTTEVLERQIYVAQGIHSNTKEDAALGRSFLTLCYYCGSRFGVIELVRNLSNEPRR